MMDYPPLFDFSTMGNFRWYDERGEFNDVFVEMVFHKDANGCIIAMHTPLKGPTGVLGCDICAREGEKLYVLRDPA